MCHCGWIASPRGMHWQVEVVAVFLQTIFCLFEVVVIWGKETTHVRHTFGTHSAHITEPGTLSDGGAAKRRKLYHVCVAATCQVPLKFQCVEVCRRIWFLCVSNLVYPVVTFRTKSEIRWFLETTLSMSRAQSLVDRLQYKWSNCVFTLYEWSPCLFTLRTEKRNPPLNLGLG